MVANNDVQNITTGALTQIEVNILSFNAHSVDWGDRMNRSTRFVHSEKLERFDDSNFKRWQKNIYMITPCLASFFIEEPTSQGEKDDD